MLCVDLAWVWPRTGAWLRCAPRDSARTWPTNWRRVSERRAAVAVAIAELQHVHAELANLARVIATGAPQTSLCLNSARAIVKTCGWGCHATCC